MTFALLALVIAALFTGAALYINVVEQPARLCLDDEALLAEWKLAYGRGQVMQASLAVAGLLLGLVAWWQTGRVGFAIGGAVLAANWPFTFAVLMPGNRTLKSIAPGQAGPESRRLIRRWGWRHAGRTALGALATAILIVAAR